MKFLWRDDIKKFYTRVEKLGENFPTIKFSNKKLGKLNCLHFATLKMAPENGSEEEKEQAEKRLIRAIKPGWCCLNCISVLILLDIHWNFLERNIIK